MYTACIEEIMMNGEALRELRYRLGHSQARLAEEFGVAANTVARWERGEVPIPKAAAQLASRLEKEGVCATAISLSQVVARDSHHGAILEALNGRLDSELFEACAANLLQETWPGLTPVRGGSDQGFDGSLPAAQGESFPLITTTGTDAKRNLQRNLKTAVESHRNPTRAIFATSRRITPKTRRGLTETADELGVNLVQVYDQDWFANELYRNSSWCKMLLGVTGRPSPLSVIPATRRPLIGDRVIGRDEVLEKLRDIDHDCVLVGVPGVGKTFVLRALALEGRAHFLIDDDPEALANAIREQQPEAIIVDDAHVDPARLTRLVQLRSQLDADFRILAVSWPAELEAVLQALHLAKSDSVKLDLIDADVMVEVVKCSGIHGPNALIRSIVRQAEGRPGLASTLAYLCLRGDVQSVISGQSLLDQLAPILDDLIGADSCTVLGAFALGGASGIGLQTVSEFLEIPIYELRTKLARLAAAGVVGDLPGGAIYVGPDHFRWVLVRKTFFEGPARLPYQPLYHQLSDCRSALDTLIGARSRGATIPELEELLEAENAPRLWVEYASVSRNELKYVLKHHPELRVEISDSGLRYAPDHIIPLLLESAVDDHRALHNTLDQPIRKIQDWLGRATPEGEDIVTRRRILLRAVLRWVEVTGEFATGVRAACLALEPNFTFSDSDPGQGRTVTITSGTATNKDLEAIGNLWPEVKEIVEKGKDVPWSNLFSLIHEWLHPIPRIVPSAKDVEVRKSVAKQVLRDLAELSRDHPGIQHRLAGIALRSDIDLTVTLDTEFESLYPQEDIRRYREDFEKLSNVARDLARNWAPLEPSKVAFKLHYIETEAKLAELSFPRLSQILCKELANITNRPVELTEELTRQNVPADLLEPFVRRVTLARVEGWARLFDCCLQDERYHVVAISIGITVASLPPDFLDKVIELSSEYFRIVETRCLLGEVPEQTLVRLLNANDKRVALAAAIGEWNAEDKQSVRKSLRPTWRHVILQADCNGDAASVFGYWLGEILSSDSELARDWLIRQLQADENSYGYRQEEIVKKIVPTLNRQQKMEILGKIRSHSYGMEKLLRMLVGNDLELYGQVLSDNKLSHYHLAPLSEHPTANWSAKAILAMDNAYSSEDVAEATLPGGWSWTGPLSKMWEEWVVEFEALTEHTDVRVVRIGEIGADLARSEMERRLEKERLEAIRGH